MKLNPNANIPNFLQAVQCCKGSVHFITPEGDDLNLKSSLSQFVFAAVVAGQLAVSNGEIRLQDLQDLPALQRYLV